MRKMCISHSLAVQRERQLGASPAAAEQWQSGGTSAFTASQAERREPSSCSEGMDGGIPFLGSIACDMEKLWPHAAAPLDPCSYCPVQAPDGHSQRQGRCEGVWGRADTYKVFLATGNSACSLHI